MWVFQKIQNLFLHQMIMNIMKYLNFMFQNYEKNKSNYYIGQHGVYFSDIRGDKLRSEFSTPNKFLTWGYSDSKIYSVF